MPAFWGDEIRDLFFLALRLLAATGGFLAGWFVSGPATLLLGRLAFHRPVPQWGQYGAKLAGGALVGFLVFWYLPPGMGGGGGRSGGGTDKGVGPYTDGKGTGTATATGKGESTGKGPHTGATQREKILSVELLGGDQVKDGKYYLIGRQDPPVDGAALQKYLEQHRQELAGVDIFLTERSVGESHLAVRQLQQMANDHQLRSRLVTPSEPK
jgi:hypothetical protein